MTIAPIRVLLADGDERVAAAVRDALDGSPDGATVRQVRSVEAATAAIDAEPWDCVVTEYEIAGATADEAAAGEAVAAGADEAVDADGGTDSGDASGGGARPDGSGETGAVDRRGESERGGTTGIDLLRAVRERDPALPVIVATGAGDERVAAAAVDAGATGYVRKGDASLGELGAELAARIREAVGDGRAAASALAEDREEILDRMADGFVAVDGDDVVTYLNAQAAALAEAVGAAEPERADGTGDDPDAADPATIGDPDAADPSPAAFVGTSLWEAFPNATGTEFEAAFERARETGEPTHATTYYDLADSWFEARIYPSATGVSVYFGDVTETVEERRELERRERVMRRLYGITAARDGAFEEKVERLLALGREVLDAESGLLSRVYGDRYVVEIADDATGAFDAGATVELGETNCERVVASARSVRIRDVGDDPELASRAGFVEQGISCYIGAPVVVEDDVYGTLCFYDREARTSAFGDWEATFVDLMARWVGYELERRAAREETARERDRLDQFASAVSHDLRNPLNVAAGNLELVRDSTDDERLARAAKALDRMEELIGDALSFARLGERVVDAKPVDLDRVVEDAWTTVATGDATLEAEALGRVVGDASRLRTLFENLFRNGVEHAGDAPTLTVGWDGDALVVADDGPGVPADERDRVFETGYTTTPEGTGFGLGIVKTVAEAHGWRVRVTEAASGGARFEFDGVVRDGPE